MKRLLSIIMCCLILIPLAACTKTNAVSEDGNAATQINSQTENALKQDKAALENENSMSTQADSGTQTKTAGNNQIVVYFSWSGNTEAVAKEIQSQTGADIFQIIPVKAYSSNYNEVVDYAKKEQGENARPEISGKIDNINQYDVIYFGFPNWWGDMPMIMYSFLDDYDLSGKTIVPFVTSGGSGFSNTINTIKKMEPGATVLNGLSLGSSQAKNSSGDVEKWLKGLDFGK